MTPEEMKQLAALVNKFRGAVVSSPERMDAWLAFAQDVNIMCYTFSQFGLDLPPAQGPKPTVAEAAAFLGFRSLN